jgi:hypothetical protein
MATTTKQNIVKVEIPRKLYDYFFNLFHYPGMRTITQHHYVSGIINECLLYPDKYKVKTDEIIRWISASKGEKGPLKVSFTKTELFLLEQHALGGFRSNQGQLNYIISNFAAWASQNGYTQVVLNEDKSFSLKKLRNHLY